MAARVRVLPRKRTEHLVDVELSDEVVVYDRRNGAAHALNGPAALVWKSLDQEITIKDLSGRLRNAFGGAETDDAAWLAMKDLAKRGLLDGPLQPPAAGLSRRQLIKRVALTGIALPAIVTLATPGIAEAAGTGLACSGNICGPGCSTKFCCSCAVTTEGVSMCFVPSCLGACTSSAGCPPGQACVACCGTQQCAAVCTSSTVCAPEQGVTKQHGWGGKTS